MRKYRIKPFVFAASILAIAIAASAARAQSVTLDCPGLGGESILITVDYGSNSLTYFDRLPDGHDLAAIVSRPTVTDTTITWVQTEPFGDGGHTVVSYVLSRVSGKLNYSYNYQGPRAYDRNCVPAKAKF